MRLSKVESGHSPEVKEVLAKVEEALGAPDPSTRFLFYRPELFGRSSGIAHQEVVRGPSDWSISERELMAAFVSAQNQCPY